MHDGAPSLRSVTWSEAGGGALRLHLAQAQLQAALPAPAALLAALYALGCPQLLSLSAALLLAAAQHWLVSPLASLPIVPAQRRLRSALAWLAGESACARRCVPEAARAAAADAQRFLRQMDGEAAAARPALLRAGGAPRSVRCPDGALLDALVFNAGAPRGCLLYAGGNAELLSLQGALAALASRHRLCLVLFDYRGCGGSAGLRGAGAWEGGLTRAGGVLDVASMLAVCGGSAAAGGLGYARARTLLLGHSIGGGFSAEAARFFPGVALLADRTFGRLSDAAAHAVLPPAHTLGARARADAAARLARWALHAALVHLAGWQLDTAAHWLHVPRARRALVCAAGDRVIPWPAQLAPHLVARFGLAAAAWGGAAAHDAAEAAAAAAARAAAGGALGEDGLGCCLLLGSGSDAHNRAFSATEEAALFTRVIEPLLGYTSAPGGAVRDQLPDFLML